jgi:hypothetical protein
MAVWLPGAPVASVARYVFWRKPAYPMVVRR